MRNCGKWSRAILQSRAKSAQDFRQDNLVVSTDSAEGEVYRHLKTGSTEWMTRLEQPAAGTLTARPADRYQGYDHTAGKSETRVCI